MQEIIKKAQELGEAIAQSPFYQRLCQAEDKVRQNEEAKKLGDDFNALAMKIAQLEADRKPIEPEDKREFKRIQEAISANPLLQEHVRAQADYMDLMRQVNGAIQKALGRETAPQTAGQNGEG